MSPPGSGGTEFLRQSSRERERAGICYISTSGAKCYVILFSLSPTGNACCVGLCIQWVPLNVIPL